MATIRFTANIQRHIACPDEVVAGATVREALESYFSKHPRARGYVVDEQGALRRHIAVFLDGEVIRDRETQSEEIVAGTTIDVFQALSGG